MLTKNLNFSTLINNYCDKKDDQKSFVSLPQEELDSLKNDNILLHNHIKKINEKNAMLLEESQEIENKLEEANKTIDEKTKLINEKDIKIVI
jgi:mevalonate pyrophosphate decarboxylase